MNIEPHRHCHMIDAWWEFTAAERQPPVRQRVLPDGCNDLILSIGGCRAGARLEWSDVQYRFEDVVIPAGTSLVGIRFRPGMACRIARAGLFDIATGELAGHSLRVDPHALASRLFELAGDVAAGLVKHHHHVWVDAAVDAVARANGQIRVEHLAKEVGITPRTLHRVFLAEVGISVKAMCSIVRVRHARRLITQANQSLASTAAASGYVDQAHMCREFRALLGATPSSLRLA